MNISEFVSKWRKVELTERSASQQHFLDLCDVFEHPKPAEADPTGETFTFEKGAAKHGGGHGWADVWKRGFFSWEYKGKHKDLDAAYDQLDEAVFAAYGWEASLSDDEILARLLALNHGRAAS
jgi:hypothetical protein